MSVSETPGLRAYIALAIVCLLWGTTYFALRIGVETFPPFLFSGIRQVVAGGSLLIGLRLTGNLKINRTDVLHQSIPGVLMLALGNGVVGWCERYIPSGLAALILSLIPVFVVLINYASGLDRRRPHPLILTGLFLGCLGIALIFRDNLKDLGRPEYLSGMLVTFAACVIWAAGSVYAKHKTSGSTNVLQNAALQLFFGGLALLLFSVFLDDYHELKTVTAPSIWALVYLIVFGSIVGYTCFVYALKHLPIGVSSLYAYINPFIAILLGYFFLQEPLTGMTFLALAAALSGVYCINRGYGMGGK
ncbi:MAG: EamA family transporter [Leadbetterella sp.]|nr:EamA family transporter [Leadbetterella sp.]